MSDPSELQLRLQSLRAAGRSGLIPFLTAGYPTPESTVPLLQAVERAGAVAVEVGIPFTDPLADGPAIQHASQVALQAGGSVASALAAVAAFRAHSRLPIVIMSYANPILAFGAEAFAARAQAAGVSGVLLTDLPPEERADVWQSLAARSLDAIALIAPTTAPDRLRRLAAGSRGFVYCVSRLGTTGAPADFAGGLQELIRRVRAATETPVAIGFGVRDAERARRAASLAEGVIVGAALTERIESARPQGQGRVVAEAERWVAELASAVGGVRRESNGVA